MTEELSITRLAHAAIIVGYKGTRLLCDPWFDGTCFGDGWGLRAMHPDAMSLATQCTHLWISHPHEDHCEARTMRALAVARPDITVLANRGALLDLAPMIRQWGFRNISAVLDRVAQDIGDVEVMRFPCGPFDNALRIRCAAGTVLDFNDCLLSPFAIRALRPHIGAVDVALMNYNPAAKIVDNPNGLRQHLIDAFAVKRAAFSWIPQVVPFAGDHYWRPVESSADNAALLSASDLAGIPGVRCMAIGDELRLRSGSVRVIPALRDAVEIAPSSIEQRPSAALSTIMNAAATYCRRLRRAWPIVTRWMRPVVIEVTDLSRRIALYPSVGPVLTHRSPHMRAHSAALQMWFGTPGGTDAFLAGAHFAIADADVRPVRNMFLLGSLVDSGVRCQRAMRFPAFAWMRREELLGLVLDRTQALIPGRTGWVRGEAYDMPTPHTIEQ